MAAFTFTSYTFTTTKTLKLLKYKKGNLQKKAIYRNVDASICPVTDLTLYS